MNKKNEENELEKFSKEQIITSKKYNKHKDLLKVILKENTMYSIKQVEDKIQDFMKRKVN